MKVKLTKALSMLFVTLALVLYAFVSCAESQYPCNGTVNKPDVNVRKEASSKSNLVCQLDKNDVVTVLSEDRSGSTVWYHVEYVKGKKGYVRGDLIDLEIIAPVVSVEKLSEDKQRVSFGNGYALPIPANWHEIDTNTYNDLSKELSSLGLVDGDVILSEKALYAAGNEEESAAFIIIKYELGGELPLSEFERILKDNILEQFGELKAMVSGNLSNGNGILSYFQYVHEEVIDGQNIPITFNIVIDKQPALYLIIFAGCSEDEVINIMKYIEFERSLLADWYAPEDDGLEFFDWNGTTERNYITVTGRVKNTSRNTYKYVKVKAVFKNDEGEILDTNWTYLVGGEGLEPQEAKTFSVSVPRNDDISGYSLSILDYQID